MSDVDGNVNGGNVNVDADVYAAVDAGRVDDAFALVVARYGREIGGFLSARFLGADGAADAFAFFAEDVWRGLAKFRRAASLRTWLYVLARNAALRVKQAERRRAAREIPLSHAPAVDALEFELRAATTRWQRTDVKDHIHAIRAGLDDDDRELLVLRVDRGLSWLAIARVVHATANDVDVDGSAVGGSAVDDAALKRQAAALRKRFERIKARIESQARAAGVLEPPP